MVVYCVNVFVKADSEKEFIDATKENRKGTRKEPGNIRFDILQMDTDYGQFFLYEVYRSEESVKVHKSTDHYLKWRKKVAPMMEKPREGLKYHPVSDLV